jgi:hypothetical protein
MSDRLTERADLIDRLKTRVAFHFFTRAHVGYERDAGLMREAADALTAVASQPCAGCAALREALVKVRAHTGFRPDATLQLLVSLLASIGRIIDAALAQSRPDGA